jgi:amidohydrolase
VTANLPAGIASRIAKHADELVAIRRDLHAHPELGHAEFRTTQLLCRRLAGAGLSPRVLPSGTGVICDVGEGEQAVALRGDIDALPIPDEKHVPYRSTVPGRAHACGHDVHTTVVLGVGLVLADLARVGQLDRRVRLIFQPAEEIPGGAQDVIDAGGLEGVDRILALHCDPRLDMGRIGMRTGPITAACDRLLLRLSGSGGHTARPHLTADLVYGLGKMVTELPAALSRRVDPRSGLSLVWGRIVAGSAANVIPQTGEAEGTVRCLDLPVWREAPDLIHELVDAVAATYGVKTEIHYQRGVPPVVNDADCTALFRTAATAAFGPQAAVGTEQSLGGEDFAWYLDHVPGAMARLGVRTPGDMAFRDLHQGTFDVDERAIAIGVELLIAAALLTFR